MSVAERKSRSDRDKGTPLWVRVWHFLVALLFIALVYSGVALTFSHSDFAIMDYELASLLHEVTGIAISILYVMFLLAAIFSGYWRTYTRRMRDLSSRMVRPLRRALATDQLGALISGERRYEASTQFLLQLQQFMYLTSMAIVMPLLIVTGLIYLYPETAPDKVVGLDGLWPLAISHYVTGVLGILFLIIHVYISTIAGFRRIILGR